MTADDPVRAFYAMIPNMIDDADLSVYAFRLYCHVKRVAGEDNVCYESVRTLAQRCGMSVGQVGKARAELVARGFVEQGVKHVRGGSVIKLTITNIWRENIAKYKRSPDEQLPSESVHTVNTNEGKRSPDEHLESESVHVVNTNEESVHVVNAGVHTVNESITIEEKLKKGTARKRDRSPRERDIVFEAICEACGIDWHVCTDTQRQQANQTVVTLRRAAAKHDVDDAGTVDRIRHTRRWWKQHDWRGKHGDAPTPAQLREVWGSAMKTYQTPQQTNGHIAPDDENVLTGAALVEHMRRLQDGRTDRTV